ncbi:hypothetical protein NDU88_004165 [Pleurodeles waltl]|uniref:C2H2-type domain-containing protein n=1 Tax=Pleurodeles waltl TaxID=8319 RepID=A0AAV7RKJ3_PLEWA|nr:hypothetical protein NDU88_004165 [Pleurodeles waltl]
MADEEAEQESGGGRPGEPPGLGERLRALEEALRRSEQPADKAASEYCQRFCQTLLEFAEKWKTSEDHLPLLQVYTDAIESYSKARAYLTAECENVPVVLERLALSCVELLLGLPHDMPEKHWKGFQTAVQGSHQRLVENGNLELHFLHTLSQEKGVWKNPVLHSILHEEPVGQDKVNEFLALEAPILLEMRIKHLLKASQITQATILAKLCSDNQDLRAKGNFKQIYLVCLCSQSPNLKLIEEIAKMDCKDALEMICNLESEGDEKTALIICAAFLSRQLQLGDMDCAWELTLFWSKLQQRVDPSVQVYLERCRQLSLLTKTVYHIFFLIKIIQSEAEGAGLSTCIELCVKALRLESGENANVKISICKTISCLLPDDLEVKRACQLSEFLLEPTVDAYYAVEMLYNQPDQKYDEDSLPVPNSLRCELLLVLKTRWPFDPEFWDWKTLKRQCLALMGEEASIVSSIDELNDSEVYEKLEDSFEERKENTTNGISNSYSSSVLLRDMEEEKRKKREVKKMREKGFVSARFRNFQAYMQYCVLCDKEFLGHRIIRHAQKHHSDGVYSCPICAKKFDNKERLVPHVTLHVKQSSKERLDEMKPLRRLGRSQKLAITSEKQNSIFKPDQRSVKKNNIYSDDFVTFDDNEGSEDENCVKFKQDDTNITSQKLSDEPEFTCPVLVCKKGFKHYKNLIVHVKAHKDNEEAMHFLEMQSKKVICHYCRRHFVSVTHLNDHLQIHCGSKPYMCIQMKCGASFRSNAQLVAHKKEHQDFRAKCMFPKCGRIFSEACTLYEHEAKHYHTFTCKFKDCGKVYYSESQLESHMNSHELKQGNTLKDQESASEMYDPTLNEAKDTKNIPLKSEQIYNPNFVSSASAESESLKPIKMESFEEQQTWPNRLEHTALGTVSQQLPPSKEISNSVLPSAGISKVMSPQTNVPEQMLGQSSVDALEKADVTVSSSHIKKSPLSQGICDIILTQGKLAAAVNMIDTGNTLLSQIYTAVKDACNDSSLPLFQESKEVECFSQPQQELNVSVNSGTSKIDLAMKTVERQMGTVVHLGVDNQPLYETSFVFPEFEDRMKTANLLNLPSKTSNGSLFVSSQSSLSNPLVTSSVLKQLPLQKFTCLIEGCTRIYNSIQSIGKHMKAAHPQQYPSFTQERKRRKRQRSRNSANAKALLNMSPKASCSNNAVSPHNKSSNANHSFSKNDFSKIVTSETNQIPDCSADCSFSTKSSLLEKTHVDDEKILEILQRLQCLRLENDSAVDGLESDASASPPSGISSPLTSISFVASKGGCGHQAPETDICNSLLDETVKPFVCREKTCDYRAMSKDALFKHYRRVHKYTEDILMDIKKNHLKFAPFRCVIPDCPKTFTRNSNLRAHCQSVHHFSTEEMEKLRFKRPYELSLCEGMITPPRSDGQKRRQVQIENELKTEPPPLVIQTPMKKEFDQNTYEQISSDQESRVGLTIRKQENLPKLASLLQEQRKKEALRKKMRKQMKAREERLQKMRLENDGTLPAKYSPYRPYRCVHQDCFAAFTIQQNLILHYQAMHSSDLPTFGLQLEDENETYKDVHDEIESSQIGKEFRCQEYDCSRIFQEVASLIQHYMKLHEMFPEEIEQVMSVTNTGKFKCDQPQCISSFTTCSNYLAHLETHHGVKIRQCGEDGIYKCDCEGCDRIYATRSNLLRHIYSKHNERHKAHLMRPRRFLQDDEENNSSKANEDRQMRYKPHELQYDSFGNEKMRKKNPEFENDMSEINRNLPVSPLKYGKKFLFLKTKYDALAECSDSLPKQYPCMIKGCTSIVTSEHNIIRHYKCHKITRAFTLTHRATLIICKKLHVCRLKASASDDETARRKRKELKGSAMSSSESSDESVSQLSEIEKDEVDELAELLHTKLFNEDSDAAENQARTTSIKNREIKKACSHPGKQGSNNILKRVHRQKLASQNKKRKIEKSEEKLAAEIRSIQSGEETISSETADEPLPVIDLSSFKPMGFEMSFLKFLEESAVKEKKKTKRDCTGLKTDLHLNLAKSSQEAASEDDGSGETSSEEEGSEKFTRKKPSLIDYHSCPITDCENLIQFANPSHLQCIGIVRFVLDERLNNCFELAFKQLQEMRPTVVLKKVDMHCDGEIITSEQSCYVERNFDVAH